MDKKTDEQLTRLLLKKIGPVDLDLVIGKVDVSGKNLIQLGGKRAEDAEALALKREAEMIEQTKLWKVMTETLRYQAQRRMFEESKSSEDVYASGKFLLHAISTMEATVRACKNPLLLADQKATSVASRPRRRPTENGDNSS